MATPEVPPPVVGEQAEKPPSKPEVKTPSTETPKDTPVVEPTLIPPKPKFAPKPSRKNQAPKIKHTIQNLAQLNVSKLPTESPVVQPPLPEPKPIGTYFNSLDIKSHLSTTTGKKFTIDVQSDTRFLTAYVHQTVDQCYKTLTSNDDPYVSSTSYIGYNLCLFYTQALILDLKCRSEPSAFSIPFVDSPRLSSLVSTLMECVVTPELSIELKNYAPVYDPLHSDLEFIPNFACFSFEHDFGRSIPGYLYFLIHDILADIETFDNAKSLMNSIYSTPLLAIPDHNLTISNLFGGPYIEGTATHSHENWFRKCFERTLIPVLGQCLELNPTLTDMDFTAPNFLNIGQINPYVYLTMGHQQNLTSYLNLMTKISASLRNQNPNLPTLGSFLGTVSGITILSHSIESPTLPTWHGLRTVNFKTTTKSINDKAFAEKIHFLVERLTYTKTLPYPSDPIEKDLYLVESKKYTPSKDHVKYIIFDPRFNVAPDVLWFQPYSRGTGELNHSLVLGLKIESAEIDGATIPVPNPTLTLMSQNSEYIQGSLPVMKVHHLFPVNGESYVRVRERTTPFEYEPLSFNRRCASRAVFPLFANEGIDDTINGTFPFTRENNQENLEWATTYNQWKRDEACPTQDSELYLWSSYRHRERLTSNALDDIHMYYSLRPLYGLNTILSSSRNPTILLPK